MTSKNLFFRHGIKSLLCLIAVVLTTFTSCKQESSDVSSLLATVPSSAGAVVGVNLKTVLEKADCEVNGSSIKAGKELENWLATIKQPGSKGEMLRVFLNSDSGVDPQGMVVFIDAYSTYATAMLADTDKFISFVEEQTGGKFSEAEGGVKVCGNIAIYGAQMWISSNSATIDAKAVKNYASLSENQNFLTKNVSKPVVEMESDIVAWGDISTLAKSFLSFGEMAQYNVVIGALFDNPVSLALSVNFEKGKLNSKIKVLNDKGETAKFLLPTKKIDANVVKGLGGTADMVVAANISKDFTKKVEKMLSSFGGGMFDAYLKPLSCVDGTIAVEAGVRENGETPLNGIVQTDGNPTPEVMNFLSQFGSTKKEGNSVMFSKGKVSGDLNVEEMASSLKGAWLGGQYSLSANSKNYKSAAMLLIPDGGGLRLEIQVDGKDSSKNILLSVLKDFSSR